MSSPTASAQVVPTNENARPQGLRNESSLRRIPSVYEVPQPTQEFRRGEVVVYSGVSFGAPRNYSVSAARPHTGTLPGSIRNVEFVTDEAQPGRIFARVLLLSEGESTPREALISPLVAVSPQDRKELDRNASLQDLVEEANIEMSRFFSGYGPIDSEVKLREFNDYIERQKSLKFLFTNMSHRNKGMKFDLFSAYFAPGGAMAGVGVFVNTWL